jgi:hypothetical protein
LRTRSDYRGARLHTLHNVVPGPVPDMLAQVAAEQIAFLSIDMN